MVFEKSVKNIMGVLSNLLHMGFYESRRGFLQNLSPPTRFAVLIALQVYIVTLDSFMRAFVAAVLLVAITATSKVPLAAISLGAAILSGPPVLIISLPSLFVKPTESLIPVISLTVSYEDITRAILFILRAYLSIFNILLLSATSSISSLACAFSLFRVPRTLIFLVVLTYLHVFTVIKAFLSRLLGYVSRFGKPSSVRGYWEAYMNVFRLTLIDSFSYGHSVSLALKSRGFSRDTPILCSRSVSLGDFLVSTFILAILIVTWIALKGWPP